MTASRQNPRVNQILATLLASDKGAETLPELLCAACLDALPVSGVGLALMSDDGHEGVVAATDGQARQLEELQFTVGEGPCLDASRDGRPVLQPDLSETGPRRWLIFGPAVLDSGVAALFAFPLQVGAIRLGVLDIYRTTTGSLNAGQLAEALAFADAAVLVLLHLQEQVNPGEGLHPELIDASGWHSEIHQSTGFIAVQAAVGLTEALLILRARAFSDNRPILDVARDVLARRLKFRPGGDPHE